MDRSEIMELRKLFRTYREDGCPVGGFSGAFIDSEGDIRGAFGIESFHNKEDAVKKRIFTIASKTISNNAVSMEINREAADLFEKIRATGGSNKELTEELSSRISDAIKEIGADNTYAVNVLGYTYDVPFKTTDHKTIIDGVSDEVFSFFVCMISPVVTGKPSYGYFPEDMEFGMNPILLSVNNPIAGFVYPDFTDRTSNMDSVLYFRTAKFDISASLFGIDAPPLPVTERKPRKTAAVQEPETVIPATGEIYEVPQEPPVEEEDRKEPETAIPSLDSGSMSLEEVRGRDIASERREEEEFREKAEAGKEEKDTDKEELSAPVKRKRRVRISGATDGLKRQMVDGVMCIIVPVSDADIE
ncbi:MAG: DUF4317 family protein [Lachnospiraceae bacterium]|nr:DUF4317 family protein [Lachnospiraceae bacterium]